MKIITIKTHFFVTLPLVLGKYTSDIDVISA